MTNCPVCGSDLKQIPAGVSKKTGKPYRAFSACPKGCKTSWNDSKPSPQPQNSPTAILNQEGGMELLMEEIAGVNKRLDEMAVFLKSKFN